jgi:uncharacterized repeat protein (TIGR03803 family)
MPWMRVLFAGLLAGLVPLAAAAGPYYTVLHKFSLGDGAFPRGPLILDVSGDLFGATMYGGAGGVGTVFRLAHDGTLSTLHDFSTAEGNPSGPLLRKSDGHFLGLTAFAGSQKSGTVFDLAEDGGFTRIHTFADDAVGYLPRGNLVADSQGDLYGETALGGANGMGTIFKLAPSGAATALYAFNRADGYNPQGDLVADAAGNLYGTTYETGFQELGSVFKVALDGTFTKLHQFTNGSDGGLPTGAFTIDADGNLYGMTSYGGAVLAGVLYKLAPDGTESVLRDFNKNDFPSSGLTIDAVGNLYGTMDGGGSGFSCRGTSCGAIFVRTTTGKFLITHNFQKHNGAAPQYPLTIDASGTVYGTTESGGIDNNGVVFKLNR